MLADTDRHTSFALEHPSEAGAERPEVCEKEDDEEAATIASEHLLARFDQLLSRGENRPTPLFYATLPCPLGMAVSIPFGTFFNPGLDGDDILLDLGIALMSLCTGVIIPLFTLNARQAFRADAEGPLVLLGVGQLQLTVAQDKKLRAYDKKTNQTWGSRCHMLLGGLWTACVVCESDQQQSIFLLLLNRPRVLLLTVHVGNFHRCSHHGQRRAGVAHAQSDHRNHSLVVCILGRTTLLLLACRTHVRHHPC